MTRLLLELDGLGNIALGALLAFFPAPVANLLGLPDVDGGFYASLFGAVLIAIGIALLIERYRRNEQVVGLGLTGALVINLSFAVALASWLTLGGLSLSLRGLVLLWLLVAVLVTFGTVELGHQLYRRPTEAA